MGQCSIFDNTQKTCTILTDSCSNKSCKNHFLYVLAGSKAYHEDLSNFYAEAMKCNVCLKVVNDYFQCNFCLSEVCKKCTEWLSLNNINPIGMVCYNNHPLRENKKAENYYKIIRNASIEHFLCDGCIVKTTGPSMQCRKCRVDYCESCYRKYVHIINLTQNFICQKKSCK